MTTSLAPAAMLIALVPETRIDPKVALQLSVIDLVMVMAPNPPGSRQSISPATAVLEIAPAKVLQGAVRLHGFASSPTPETQVRLAWALAGAPDRRTVSAAPRIAKNPSLFRIMFAPLPVVIH